MAPRDEKSLLMERMEEPSLHQLWRLTNVLFRVRNGALTHKDVKNEDRSGNVYENKGPADTMTDNYSGFCARLASFLRNWTRIRRSFWQKMQRLRGKCSETGARIGSSVHRSTNPPAGHGAVRLVAEEFLQGFNLALRQAHVLLCGNRVTGVQCCLRLLHVHFHSAL